MLTSEVVRPSLPDGETLGALVGVDRVALTSLAQAGVTEEIDKGGALFKFIIARHLDPLIAAKLQTAAGHDGFLHKVLLVDNGEQPVFESLVSHWNLLGFIRGEGKPRMEAML